MSVVTGLDLFTTLVTLTLLELVLGVDNLIFIALVSHKLPVTQQTYARRVGLLLALGMRIALLSTAYWLIHLIQPLFSLFHIAFSGRDIFLIIGGAFLLYKAIEELHAEFKQADQQTARVCLRKLWSVIAQIALLDIVFSLDSVITAVGMTPHFWIMVIAIVMAIAAMLFLAESLSHFIQKNPTVRVLAFSFLLLVGMVLLADGFHLHVPRSYVYCAIGFSMGVEMLNLLLHSRRMRAQVHKNKN